MTDNITRFILILIGLLMLLSMAFNVQFYYSLSQGVVQTTTYVILAVVFDLAKIATLIAAIYFFKILDNWLLGAMAGIACLALTLVSITTSFGFFSYMTQQYENQAVKMSMVFQSLEADVKSSKKAKEAYQKYAAINPEALKVELSEINHELVGLKADLDGCPKNYFTNCIDPLKEKIKGLESDAQTIRLDLSGHQSYLGAVKSYQAALDSIRELRNGDVQAANIEHPLFVALGAMILKPPKVLKFWLITITSLLTEFLSLILTVILFSVKQPIQVAAIKEKKIYQDSDLIQVKNAIKDGKLSNLSFNALKQWFKDNLGRSLSQAKIDSIRKQLVYEGYAEETPAKKLVVIK